MPVLKNFTFSSIAVLSSSQSCMTGASKRQVMSDIVDIVASARDQCESHHREAESMKDFLAKMEALIAEEAPEFLEKFKEIAGIMTQSIQCDDRIASAEERLMEDYNDIKARFEVLFRTTEDTGESKIKLREARYLITKLRQDLETDRAKGGKKQYKIEAEIRAAIDSKKTAIEDLEKMYVELTSTRDRYNRFKVRRLRNAYGNLGREVAAASNEQQEILGRLRKCIGEAREGVELMLNGQTLPVTTYDAATPQEAVPPPAQSMYDRPYEPSPFEQPGYGQPGYVQPGYGQPQYAAPGYPQPGYAQPYEPPAYNYGGYGATPFD